MKNPFVHGEVAYGDSFADRKNELTELVNSLGDGERVFLLSPRRYGKTSLIKNVMSRLKGTGCLTAYVDMFRATSLEQFAILYAKEIFRAYESKVESILRIIKETLPFLRPRVGVDPYGEISMEVDVSSPEKELFQLIAELLDATEKIAKKKNKRFVVAFDEFQEVKNLGGAAFEKLLRSSFQNHHHAAYIFSGSKQRILKDMIYDKAKGFYKLGRVHFLGKIPDDEFYPFIANHFKQVGAGLTKEVAETVLNETERIPYYVQFVCSALWNRCREGAKLSQDMAVETVNNLVNAQSPIYQTIWDGLSMHQRKVLQAISKSDGKGIFSHEFIENNRLGPIATVQTSLKLLIKKGPIDREDGTYVFSDPLFKKWVISSAT